MELIKYKTSIIFLFAICVFAVLPSTVIGQKQFVAEKTYKSNLAKQQKSSIQTLAQLRNDNITESDELKLEYFFHTNTSKKAKELTDQLQIFGYEAAFKKSTDSPDLYLITGWTMKMKMKEKLILEWTKVMCDLGYEFDCQFKSWKRDSR